MPELDIALDYMVTGAKWGLYLGFVVLVAGWGFGLLLDFIKCCFKN